MTGEVKVGEASGILAPLVIIPRKERGALPPKARRRLDLPVLKLLISHTQSDSCTTREECNKLMQDMQKQHMAEGQPDIRFNFVVGGDGVVYEGRGWDFYPWNHPEFPRLYGFAIEISHAGRIGTKTKWNELSGRLQLIEYGEAESYITTVPEVEYFFDSY